MMKNNVFEGKTVEEALKKAFEELKVEEKDILYQQQEKKSGIFKGNSIQLNVYLVKDILDFIKNYLSELLTNMGISTTFETSIRDTQFNIKMYSDNNSILIGKDGQTLKSLQNIVRQVVYKEIGIYIYILLDVEDYKSKKIMHLERLAKNVAREVATTQIPVSLENMNSYERRIVHSILSNNKKVDTSSEGEEPNRHVVITPKEK